jgi:hypothetical protein
LTFLFVAALLTFLAKQTSGVISLVATVVGSAISSAFVELGRNFVRNTYYPYVAVTVRATTMHVRQLALAQTLLMPTDADQAGSAG